MEFNVANLMNFKTNNLEFDYQANKTDSSSNKEFASYMDKANNGYEKKSDNVNSKEDNRVKRDTKQKTRETNTGANKEEAPAKQDRIEDKAVIEKPVVDKPEEVKKQTDKEQNVEKAEIEDPEVIEKIAEILNIPVEVVFQALKDLDINVADLTDPGKLTAFVQQALNAETPAELLVIPNVKEIFDSIKEVLAEADTNKQVNLPEITMQNKSGEKAAEVIQEAYADADKPAVNDGAVQAGYEENTNEPSTFAHKDNEQRLADNTGDNNHAEIPVYVKQEETATTVVTDTETVMDNSTGFATIEHTLTKTIESKEVFSTNQTKHIVNQIVENLKVNVKSDMTELKITLRPEQLGELNLKISTENGIVTAQFMAENQRVKEIIEANFNHLKDTLEENGINVSQLSVSVSQDESEKQMQQFMAEQRKSGKRIQQIIEKISLPDENHDYNNQNIMSDSRVDYLA